MSNWVSLLPVHAEKRGSLIFEQNDYEMGNLSWADGLVVFMLKGDDQGQNKYHRKANEALERDSKAVGLKCL